METAPFLRALAFTWSISKPAGRFVFLSKERLTPFKCSLSGGFLVKQVGDELKAANCGDYCDEKLEKVKPLSSCATICVSLG